MNPKNLLSLIIKNPWGIAIVAVLLVLAYMFLIAPIFATAQQQIDDYFFRENLEDLKRSPIEDKSPAEISAEGFKSFGYELTQEEIESITIEENVEKANEIAGDLDVYDFQYEFYTEFELDEYDLQNTQLTYDGTFMQRDFSDKWRDFFFGELNLFADEDRYDITFRADVYAKGADFPLNYKEDTYFEFNQENRLYMRGGWDLFFDGGMELVLPDKNNDNKADRMDLVMEVQVAAKGNEGSTANRVFEIPLYVRDGEITTTG